MERVVIIGSGNVAEALVRALCKAGAPPVQLFARDRAKAAAVAALCGCPYADDPRELAQADLYLVAVSDKAIRGVISTLQFGNGVVAHTAGSVGLEVFPQHISRKAVFYPLQTFTKGRRVDMDHVPILIEAGDTRTLEVVGRVASMISDTVMEVAAPRRMALHAAAVFTNNFANYMFTVGQELAHDAGFDFEVLKPLIRETADKALDAQSPRDVQTGPAVRNDFETRSKHIELLAPRPDLKNIYISISKNIWETSKKT